MSVYERILVTLDGSLLAERALEPAVLLAQASGAELILLRVVTPIELWAPFVEIEPAFEVAQERQIRETSVYLEEVRDRLLEDEEALNVRTIALRGPVAETITDYARQNSVDLIVISSHGRSGISRWIYGSVAEKVLRGTRCCSTLIVRDEEARRERKEETPDAAATKMG
ncbi:MAG: universal stress protein [Candidatus Promineifilaceae bacterium]|nr:universal stress protein [Candidatus Promineifilaceae bacterium]